MTARDYAKVLPAFWTGTTGRAIRALGADCQVIALYLMTSPHASAIGLYHLPLAYLCADTGSPLEGARKALRSLSEVSFCAYDEASETVWIPEMARHQVGDAVKPSDNRRPWLVKEAERMRKRPFFNDFLAKYGAAFSLGIAPDSKPLGSPLEAPSEALRSQEQEREREQEQERETHAHEDRPETRPNPTDRMLASLEPTSGAELREADEMVRRFEAGWRRVTGTGLGVQAKRERERSRALLAWARVESPSDPGAAVELAAEAAARDPEVTKAGSAWAWFCAKPGKYLAANRARMAQGGDAVSTLAAESRAKLRAADEALAAGNRALHTALTRESQALAQQVAQLRRSA